MRSKKEDRQHDLYRQFFPSNGKSDDSLKLENLIKADVQKQTVT